MTPIRKAFFGACRGHQPYWAQNALFSPLNPQFKTIFAVFRKYLFSFGRPRFCFSLIANISPPRFPSTLNLKFIHTIIRYQNILSLAQHHYSLLYVIISKLILQYFIWNLEINCCRWRSIHDETCIINCFSPETFCQSCIQFHSSRIFLHCYVHSFSYSIMLWTPFICQVTRNGFCFAEL